MSARDIFGLAVRICGGAFIVCGYFALFHAVAAPFGYPRHYPIAVDLIGAAGWLIPGFALLLGARPVTNLAYWRDK